MFYLISKILLIHLRVLFVHVLMELLEIQICAGGPKFIFFVVVTFIKDENICIFS